MSEVATAQLQPGWHKVILCLVAQIFRQMCLPVNCCIFSKLWLINHLSLFLYVNYSSSFSLSLLLSSTYPISPSIPLSFTLFTYHLFSFTLFFSYPTSSTFFHHLPIPCLSSSVFFSLPLSS